jgi:hypothetical protein
MWPFFVDVVNGVTAVFVVLDMSVRKLVVLFHKSS